MRVRDDRAVRLPEQSRQDQTGHVLCSNGAGLHRARSILEGVDVVQVTAVQHERCENLGGLEVRVSSPVYTNSLLPSTEQKLAQQKKNQCIRAALENRISSC